MAAIFADRVAVTSISTGTGNFTMGAALTSYQPFAGAIADATDMYYAIVDEAAGAWEVGIGRLSGNGLTLTRTTILDSSTGVRISFAAGPKIVYSPSPAQAFQDVQTATTLAEAWAQNPEDVPVVPGEFSALHWAAKAQANTFPTRAALVAKIAGGWVPTVGVTYTAAGLGYLGQALATEIPDAPGVVPAGKATPGHYGAVGSGAGNDGPALLAAWATGREIDHGAFNYAFSTTLTATLPGIRWEASGARLIYTGPAARFAIDLTVGLNLVASLSGSGLTVDGGGTAFTALRISSSALVADPLENWPRLQMDHMIATNYRRASLAFSGGDGIIIPGGWRSVVLTGVRVTNGKQAVGADLAGSQGIFGITVGSSALPQPKAIRISGWSAENIWSEDPTVTFDQDALRIFQDMNDPTAVCQITNGIVRNVTGRAIKLHSGPNAIIDGLHRVLQSTVVPQQGSYSAPDIDCQQAPATVTNLRFEYDGTWHDGLVQVTDRGAYPYGGQNVSNVSWDVRNAAANAITAVRFTAAPDQGPDSAFRGTVSGLSGRGAINTFCSISMMGAGTNAIGLFNAVGEVKFRAVTFTGGTGTLRVAAGGVINTGPVIEFSSNRTTAWQCSVVNAFGFTGANISSEAQFKAPLDVDQGTAGGVIATFRGNNPRVEIFDSVGTLSTGALVQTDGAFIHYADYYGTAAGVASHDFRINGTATGNRALVMSGADYSSQFFGPIRAFAGTEALPGISFVSDVSTGFYRIGLGRIGMSVSGVLQTTFTATGTFETHPGPFADDAAAAAGGVGLGQTYRKPAGVTSWRQV